MNRQTYDIRTYKSPDFTTGDTMSRLNNYGINYADYFMFRVKEYLMNIKTQNKMLFVFKILMLINYDSIVGYFLSIIKYYYYTRIKDNLQKIPYYSNSITMSIKNELIKGAMYRFLSKKISNVHDYIVSQQDASDNIMITAAAGNYEILDHYCFKDGGLEINHEGVKMYFYTDYTNQTNNDTYVILSSRQKTKKELVDVFNDIIMNSVQHYNYITIIDQNGVGDRSRAKNPTIIKRDTQNLFLQEDIEKHIHHFISNYRAIYNEYVRANLTYKNIFLVYGEPGTGKSTLAKVIAKELRRNICLVNLKSIKNLESLQEIISTHSSNVIVFEELDCLIESLKKRTTEAESQMTKMAHQFSNSMMRYTQPISNDINALSFGDFQNTLELSDFLEILDGMRTANDSIIFFTTNHIEKIDPAFKRHGRINHLIEMKLCNKYQVNKIFKYLLNREPSVPFTEEFTEYKYSPACIIETIMMNILELKSGEMTDEKLLASINCNYDNFAKTLTKVLTSDVQLESDMPIINVDENLLSD